MILFPAVDIKDGQCVRLAQGKADQVTVFSSDPVSQGLAWSRTGAKFLHVVDLDGAFSGMPTNFELIKSLCSQISIPVQLGGGIRDIDTAKAYVQAGVTRLIIGTMALESPELFKDLCAALPGKIGVSLDAVDGKLKTRGWVEDDGRTVRDVLPGIVDAGAAFIVYTDISRDGMHSGVNLQAMEELCDSTDLPVVAAGGVSTLDDVKNIYPLHAKGLEGVISGRAIYEGTLDVPAALAWIEEQR